MRLLATIFFASAVLIAQPPAQDHAPTGLHESRVAAVNVVRTLNTAEMEYRHSHNRYAGLEELKSSDEWPKTVERMKRFTSQENVEFVAGYDSSVIVDAQGKTYRISVKPKTDKCQSSFFSDESGLIFEGKVIDCRSSSATVRSKSPWLSRARPHSDCLIAKEGFHAGLY